MSNDKTYKCEICGKVYLHNSSLNCHKLNYHGIKNDKKEYYFVTCPLCGEKIDKGHFSRHLLSVHKLDKNSREFYVFRNSYANNCFSKIEDKSVLLNLMSHFYDRYGNNITIVKNFESYYNAIRRMRKYEIDSDNHNFVYIVFEWKNKHTKLANSKELCKLMFPNEPELAKTYYEKYMLSNNPFKNHDGSLSPFSKDFIGYKNLDDMTKTKKIHEALKIDKVGRSTAQIEYWINKGFTKDEAIEKVHERQQTFSKKKCIEKYGKEEGLKIWKERQKRWMNTLNSKPYEEQLRILKAKVENSKVNKPYSRIEHEFSSQLVTDEYMNVLATPYAIPDICVGNKIIDFFGDYYHCNPNKYEGDYYNHRARKCAWQIWEHDKMRKERLENDGYVVKIVWESEYKADKKKVIQECKDFLESN